MGSDSGARDAQLLADASALATWRTTPAYAVVDRLWAEAEREAVERLVDREDAEARATVKAIRLMRQEVDRVVGKAQKLMKERRG